MWHQSAIFEKSWPLVLKSEQFSPTWSCWSRQQDTTSSGWKFRLNDLAVKGLNVRIWRLKSISTLKGLGGQIHPHITICTAVLGEATAMAENLPYIITSTRSYALLCWERPRQWPKIYPILFPPHDQTSIYYLCALQLTGTLRGFVIECASRATWPAGVKASK